MGRARGGRPDGSGLLRIRLWGRRAAWKRRVELFGDAQQEFRQVIGVDRGLASACKGLFKPHRGIPHRIGNAVIGIHMHHAAPWFVAAANNPRPGLVNRDWSPLVLISRAIAA